MCKIWRSVFPDYILKTTVCRRLVENRTEYSSNKLFRPASLTQNQMLWILPNEWCRPQSIWFIWTLFHGYVSLNLGSFFNTPLMFLLLNYLSVSPEYSFLWQVFEMWKRVNFFFLYSICVKFFDNTREGNWLKCFELESSLAVRSFLIKILKTAFYK